MAQYIFTQDYTATTKNASLGPNAADIVKNFKQGDVIDGIETTITNGNGGIQVIQTNIDGTIPREGFVGAAVFNIPLTVLTPHTANGNGNGNNNVNKSSTATTVFTAKNILIMVVVLLAIFGMLKLIKVI